MAIVTIPDNIPPPIIIIGSPRSGTSLTASLFFEHGVWVGTSRQPDQWNPAYHENIPLANLRLAEQHQMGNIDGMDPKRVYYCITIDGYAGGPWLVKHSPPTWRAWRRFSPTWVFVRRDRKQIMRSRIECGHWDMTQAEHNIAVDTDIAILKSIKKYVGGFEVWPDRLLDGDWSALKEVVPGFNQATADKVLQSTIWHKGAA